MSIDPEFWTGPVFWGIVIVAFLAIDAVAVAVVIRSRRSRDDLYLTGLDGYRPEDGTRLVQRPQRAGRP
ncbi:MAG: hypothetical protein QM658_02010 [Gordonia sp. (in: high G+C Gram-positive bacteria)]